MNKTKPTLSLILYAISIAITGCSFWEVIAQYQLSKTHFHAASVMPVVWQNVPGQLPELYVLLSREAGGKDAGTYDDWGGSRDEDENHPVITAAREFAEEAIARKTLHMGVNDVKRYIDASRRGTFFVIVQEKVSGKSTMVTYITLFKPEKINKFIATFYTARQKAHGWKYKEKDSLALIPWANLAETIRNAKHAKNVTIVADVVNQITGEFETETIRLRPGLVAKLRSFFKGQPYIYGESENILFFKQYKQKRKKSIEAPAWMHPWLIMDDDSPTCPS